MEKLKTVSLQDAKEFFASYLREAMTNQKVSASDTSFSYLVELLVRYMETSQFFTTDETGKYKNNVLVDLLKDALEKDEAAKKLALQKLGDICMVISGMFSDSLNRKTVAVDYYFGMGGTAYKNLAALQSSKIRSRVFTELAQNFKPFSNVLGEIGHRSGLQSNADVMKLYEKWIYSGSENLRALLEKQGITNLIPVNPKTKH